MKVIQVVYNEAGKILSAGLGQEPGSGKKARGLKCRPAPSAGRYVAELELPEEGSSESFKELVDRLRVDVTANRPKLVLR